MREGIVVMVTAGYTTLPAIRMMEVVRRPNPVDMELSIVVMVGTDCCHWIVRRRSAVKTAQ